MKYLFLWPGQIAFWLWRQLVVNCLCLLVLKWTIRMPYRFSDLNHLEVCSCLFDLERWCRQLGECDFYRRLICILWCSYQIRNSYSSLDRQGEPVGLSFPLNTLLRQEVGGGVGRCPPAVAADQQCQELYVTGRTNDWKDHDHRHSRLRRVVIGQYQLVILSPLTTFSLYLSRIQQCGVWGQLQDVGVACPLWWCLHLFQQNVLLTPLHGRPLQQGMILPYPVPCF